ncbi:hypothetical protein NDN08_007539 [Rhodosorus marinus]|uniref:60S ribosomal export protein NMD3 n=1 Tax=Rhodosorus marinus TaxID=101924 RepID=A0AAV8UXU6_9RHOD|nr:hypothetical protein NDN08_007539 [Rhodosorus marinus]
METGFVAGVCGHRLPGRGRQVCGRSGEGDSLGLSGSVRRVQVRRWRGQGVRCLAENGQEAGTSAAVSKPLRLERGEMRAKGKLKKTTSLGSLGLDMYGPENTPVNVTLVVKKVRSDFYVRGTVKSKLVCRCDRCGSDYEHRGKSSIEVWLATSADGEPKLASEEDTRADEAVVHFTNDMDHVDLAPHIVDGVAISLPLKKLCRNDCRGDLPTEGLPSGLDVEFLTPSGISDDEEFMEDEDLFEDMETGLSEQQRKLFRDPNQVEPLEHKLDPETVAMLREWERELREKD